MNESKFDWRGQVILEQLRQGCLYREAAAAAGMTKQGLWWRLPAYQQAPVDPYGGYMGGM